MQNKQINKQKKSKYEKYPPYTAAIFPLTLSWRRPLSYRNQSIDWFLYDNVLRHERVKGIAIGHVHESCVNKIDTISKFQCHIKLFFLCLYIDRLYLQKLANYFKLCAPFPTPQQQLNEQIWGRMYVWILQMTCFRKWFRKAGKFGDSHQGKKITQEKLKSGNLRVSRKLIKIVHFRDFFTLKTMWKVVFTGRQEVGKFAVSFWSYIIS